jgi:hypothetical protein
VANPDLAALFWFYGDVDLCVNRARLLRRYNPSAPIFGLFGGDSRDRLQFERALGSWLDDFWAHPTDNDSRWKWRNGDLVIADWFSGRGTELDWETIVVAQWDMLLLAPLDKLFAGLDRDELLLSGLRPVSEVERWWFWVRGKERREYRRFLKHVNERYGYAGTPLCGIFVVVCLPRTFLERYASIDDRELGFLEYRVPIYAQIFDIEFAQVTRFRAWWASEPATRKAPERERLINAGMYEFSRESVLEELRRPGGTPLFHPYRQVFPLELAPPGPADGA